MDDSQVLRRVKPRTLMKFFHSHTITWNTNTLIKGSRYHHTTTGILSHQQHSAHKKYTNSFRPCVPLAPMMSLDENISSYTNVFKC